MTQTSLYYLMADDSLIHYTVTSALVVVYLMTFVQFIFVTVALSIQNARTTVHIYEQVCERFFNNVLKSIIRGYICY